jgi:amidase
MARTVQDVALMLSAIAGPDPRFPISIAESSDMFTQTLDRSFKGAKVAWSMDLGGLPVDTRVSETIEKQRNVFESLGCVLEEEFPDFSEADEAFKVWRAWLFDLQYGELLNTHRELMKDTVIWNTEEGGKQSGPQIGQAEIKRTALYHRFREFMESYEFLILPVSQVPPFDVKQQYITEINGIKMETYLDWMRSCYYISVTGHPAISVPCGFTPEGLPVGVQMVGRHQCEFSVLQLAHAFEQATGFWKQRPAVVD